MNFTKSIGFKMAAGTALGLLAIIGLFSFMSIRLTESRLIKTAEIEASKTSDAIKYSLESAMLSNDKAWIDSVIYAISQKPMVQDIRILDAKGTVKWAKDKSTQGMILDRQTDMSCRLCHMGKTTLFENRTIHFEDKLGVDTLRNVNPIENKPACHRCHDPKDRLIGKLLVDFNTRDVDLAMKESRRVLLTSSIFTLIVALFGIRMLFNRLVRDPLALILEKMQLAGKGDLTVSVPVKGDDEIAELATEFNEMVADIRKSEDKVQRQMDEMLTLFNVSDILNRSDSIEEAGELITNAINLGFNVEEATIMLFNDSGALELTASLGMDTARTDILKNYIATSGVREKLLDGHPFRCDGDCGEVGRFLAVPLKAAKQVMGVITIHKIRHRNIGDGEVIRLITVVATEIAPHFFVAKQLDEKRAQKAGPFASFIEAVDAEIAKVKEYYGVFSLGIVQIANYRELCDSTGIEAASELAQRTGAAISASITAVHKTIRLMDDTFAITLPMIDQAQASEILDSAIRGAGGAPATTVRVVSFPEDGSSALELVYAMKKPKTP